MSDDPSKAIDAQIAALGDWRAKTLAAARRAILAADDGIVETVKWVKPTNPNGVPVWEKDGILCTGEVYKDKVKLTFAKGATLEDPAGLFNASLDGNARRAIDYAAADLIDHRALTALVKSAIALNGG